MYGEYGASSSGIAEIAETGLVDGSAYPPLLRPQFTPAYFLAAPFLLMGWVTLPSLLSPTSSLYGLSFAVGLFIIAAAPPLHI